MLTSIGRGWCRAIPAIALLAAPLAHTRGTASRAERVQAAEVKVRKPAGGHSGY